MTIKEAIAQLNDLYDDRKSLLRGNGDNDIYLDDIEAIDIAIAALAKLIDNGTDVIGLTDWRDDYD